MRWLLVLLLTASSAAAQTPASGFGPFQCPHTTIGWSLQWSGPITSASYDSGNQLLFIVFNYKTVQAFSNVPIGLMQSLSQTQQPIAIYNSSIISGYHQILLSEKDNCPLSWEFGGNPYGYIWTD